MRFVGIVNRNAQFRIGQNPIACAAGSERGWGGGGGGVVPLEPKSNPGTVRSHWEVIDIFLPQITLSHQDHKADQVQMI